MQTGNWSIPKLMSDARSDYNAAKSNRFRRRRTGLPYDGHSADYHYRHESDYLKLIESARDMDRNDMLVGQVVDRAVTNEVQQGFTLDPQTPDASLNEYIRDELWKPWANDADQCDAQGEHTFSDLEAFVSRHCKVDGDIVAIPENIDSGGRIRLYEAHRIRTPRNARKSKSNSNVIHGIRINQARRRTEYWITKSDIDPSRVVDKVSDMVRVPVRNRDGHRQLCHIYQSKRVTQTRGVTAFAPIFDLLGYVEDINFAKMIQQQIVSCFAIFRQRDASFMSGNEIYDDTETAGRRGDRTFDVTPNGTRRTIEGIAPGMEIIGEPGEELKGFAPNVAHADFIEHVKLLITLVGANLGLPLAMVMMDASETNFSGWRGAIDQARMGFRHNQARLIRKFHSPIYRIKLMQWAITDPRVRQAFATFGPALFAHTWHPPTWPYIEPFKDAQADDLILSRGLASRRRVFATKGLDSDTVDTEIVSDNKSLILKAKRAAQEINSEFPEDPVTWLNVLNPYGAPAAAVDADSGNEQTASRQVPEDAS